ncbi:hypothetical protein Tco_0989090 [Tanacetum coccineum]|uniref:Xylulose kinase-1 n=1 Tax=Tanacetum coccineum TaxID=301880 RepID=A0ABQ5ESN2_9ASTR
MPKLAFCDYHNMVAILEKTESNTDFHQIVDFLEASHIRYALTVHPTVYVSHIQQFWSTAKVETVDGETKIIAKVNGRKRTVTESSIRRHLKLLDDEVPQGEGSENPTEPHHTPSEDSEQRTHEFMHVYLAYASFWSTARVDTLNGETKIIAKVNGRQRTVTESSIRRHLKLLDDEAITLPSQSHPDISTPRRLTRGAIWISQSKAPTPGADETASPTRDDRHGEAFPTATSLDAGQDRENIAKTSAMPHEASPGVTSLGGGEGSMQQKLQELMDMCTNLQQQHLLMEQRIQSQDLEITQGMDQGEDLMTGDVEKSTGKGSDNTDEAANVLSTLEAANVLSSGSLPTVAPAGCCTMLVEVFLFVPTISAKGKRMEKMVEFTGMENPVADFVPMIYRQKVKDWLRDRNSVAQEALMR